MKKYLKFGLIQVLILLCLSGFSQKKYMSYGDVSIEDLTMQYCPYDSSANAMILGDIGRVSFIASESDGWQILFERHVRYKIFKSSAYDLANFVIETYKSDAYHEEVVSSVKAATYNLENGKVIKSKVDGSAKNKEKVDDYWDATRITFPNVTEGSVIEISYSITSDFLFDMDDWYFQDVIPVKYSEYKTEVPEMFIYKEFMQGFEQVQRSQTGYPRKYTIIYGGEVGPNGYSSGGNYTFDVNIKETKYIATDVPAFKKESYMNNVKNYLTIIKHELERVVPKYGMTTDISLNWENVRKKLMDNEDFGMQCNRMGMFDNEAQRFKENYTDPQSRMVAAYEFIKNKMKWNGYKSKYSSGSQTLIFNKGEGNSADINLMLVELLRKAGLDANPVIISTRDHGIINPGQILISNYNYVIACVDINGKRYLLDATDRNCPYYLLPERCINGQGRLISETHSDWVDINSSQKGISTILLSVNLNTNDVLEGNIINSVDNFYALNERNSIQSYVNIEDFIADEEKENPGISIINYSFDNLDSIEKPLTKKYDVVMNNNLDVVGDIIYFTPVLIDRTSENPFKMVDRKFPVDFIYPRINKFILNLTLPDGYIIEELPKALSLALPNNGGKFTYVSQLSGNNLQVIVSLAINKAIYSSDDYAFLKQFYDEIVKKENEQIVIKKKSAI